MENIKNYIVVQSRDKYNISPIPKRWLINESKFILGGICQWYWPAEFPIKKSECYAEVNKDWDIRSGVGLNMSGNINILANVKISLCVNDSNHNFYVYG